MFQRHERRHKKEPDALRILDAHRNVVQKYKNKDDEHLDGSGSENAQLPTLRADHETYPPYIGPPSVPVKTKSAPSSIEASESFQEPVYDDGAPRVHRSGSDISKLLTFSTSALLAQRINPILEAYQADLPARVTEAFEKMFYRKLQACSEDEYCADSDEETGTYASHQLRALSASTGSSPLPSTPESRRSLSRTEKSVEIRAPLPRIIGETRMMNREMVDQKNGVLMILCQTYDSHVHSRNTIRAAKKPLLAFIPALRPLRE